MLKNATETAIDRYTQLEVELIQTLPTQLLEELHQGLVQAATDEHLKRRNWRFQAAIYFLVASALIFGVVSLFSTTVEAAKALCFLNMATAAFYFGRSEMEIPTFYTVGLRFSLEDGKTFAVHEWCCKPDNPPALRHWKQALTGEYGPIMAQVALVSDQMKDILFDQPLPKRLARAAVIIFGSLWLSFIFGRIVQLGVLCYVVLEISKIRRLQRIGVRAKIDPGDYVVTAAATTIAQTLDYRLHQPSRRV